MNADSKDSDIELVQRAVNLLVEHFDTVQVFVTKHDPAVTDGTAHITVGAGNYFARYGQLSAYLARENELLRKSVR